VTKNFNPERVSRVILAEMSMHLAKVQNNVMTKSEIDASREVIVSFLRRLQDGGDIPEDVNINYVHASVHENDRSTIDIKLPVRLRLYIQEGAESVLTARFQHDCSQCSFLGHGLDCDLYHCCKNKNLPTVTARHSSIQSDYESGISVARLLPVTEPLGLAFALALEWKTKLAGLD